MENEIYSTDRNEKIAQMKVHAKELEKKLARLFNEPEEDIDDDPVLRLLIAKGVIKK